jgi:hypothetical protein
MLLTGEGKKAGLAGHFADVELSAPGTFDLPGRLPAQVCGLSLGLWPGTAQPRGARTSAAGRRSFLLYFRPYVALPGQVAVHVMPEQFAIVSRIYAQFGVVCVAGANECAGNGDYVQVEIAPAWGAMFVRAAAPGRTTSEQVAAAHGAFCDDASLQAAYLELPTAHSATVQVCQEAKELGYVFAAVIPRLFHGSDGIRLQYVKSGVELSSLEVAHPFGREILAFIRSERRDTT